MANNRPMLEVSSVVGGVEEGDEEIELSLGLSVGGSFRKSTKLKPEVEKTTNSCEKFNSESTDVDADPSRENQCLSRSSLVNLLVGDSEPESGSEYLDPQRKREIHALRRQAARKKREEKLRKGVGRGMNGGLMVASDFSDDKMWLEAQRLQNWVRDREMRENEANVAERECKRDKKALGNKCVVNEDRKDLNLTAKHNGAQNLSHGSSAAAAVCGGSPSPIPVVPVQYPYPPLQYVPFANGFAYPCVMPCWAPTAGNVGNDKNVQQPVARRSFQPYQGNLNSGHNPLMGSDSEHNSGKDGGNQNAVSNGSPVCSSSVVSEHGSTSRQGGSSSDTGSHSSHCKPEQSQLNTVSEQLGQSDYSVSSNQMESAQANGKAANYIKAVSPGIIQSSLPKLSEQTSSVTQPDPVEKHITSENPNPGPSKVASRDMSKPPKPETHSHDTAFFSQMPCVSTTGNGPNGKTITGFLYRYTKTEVSIICVCHGSSFSPAEFVEHAGGKDITHPLRHITVIPSALG